MGTWKYCPRCSGTLAGGKCGAVYDTPRGKITCAELRDYTSEFPCWFSVEDGEPHAVYRVGGAWFVSWMDPNNGDVRSEEKFTGHRARTRAMDRARFGDGF